MSGRENLKTRNAFFSLDCSVRRRFIRFVGLLEELYGVRLPVPSLDGDERLSALKKFCGGLIEGSVHPWRRSICRLSSDARMSIAMSLFLFRKTLPSSEPDMRAYAERMSSPRPDYDPSFLRFARREVKKMFPVGWDLTSYPTACINSTLSESSCFQNKRADGGCRSYVLSGGVSWNDHAKYVEKVLTMETADSLSPSKVAKVETGGKWRVVSTADCHMSLLKPLNTSIYNRLSRFDWLLRGEATLKAFRGFKRKQGEVFVSGDYESATDNLSMDVQKGILSAILENSHSVPQGVKDLAADSQELDLLLEGQIYRQRRGQLMGNLLSFPLLCIVNYLAFRFYTGTAKGELPVKINGDDIVFRSTPEVAKKWSDGVVGSGLTLSKGKTMVHKTYFSLNSKLFTARSKNLRIVPAIRSTAFGFKDVEDGVYSVSGRWKRVLQDFPCSKRKCEVLAKHFLRLNCKYVVASRRSITRGLDMRVPVGAIMSVNLWRRECFYLSFPKEEPLPLSPQARATLRIPEGWECRRVENPTEEMFEKEKEIGPAFLEFAWDGKGFSREISPAERREDYKRQVALSPSYRPGLIKSRKKQARLLGLSLQNTKRFLKPTILRDGRVLRDPYEIVRIYRPSGKRMWLPIGFLSREQFSLKGLGADPEPEWSDPTPGLSLGRGTVWDCSSEDGETLIQCLPGAKVKLFNGFIGIGPPTCF
nr:MAG: RNA-dependent RNA polymerase [Botourmiaviridae sp.]